MHDRNKEFGSHQMIGTGTVDFELFKQFSGNDVYLNYEVRPVEEAKESMHTLARIWRI